MRQDLGRKQRGGERRRQGGMDVEGEMKEGERKQKEADKGERTR